MDIDKNANKKEFTFSIVINLFDNEDLLINSMNSIINQTLDFKDNIEIIILSYKNEDTITLIKEYKEQYPENIKYLQVETTDKTENRKIAIKKALGKYINFIESGDYFSENTLEEVYPLFEIYDNNINLLAISSSFSEQNFILKENDEINKIINLKKEAFNSQLPIQSYFFKQESLKEYLFNNSIVFGEDSLLINDLYVKNEEYLFIKNVKVFVDDKNIQNHSTSFPLNLLNDLIELGENEKNIPKFIQYALTNVLQKYFNNDLSHIKKEELEQKLDSVLNKIDFDVLIRNNYLKNNVKEYLIYLKNHDNFLSLDEISNIDSTFITEIFTNYKVYIHDITINDNCLSIIGLLESPFEREDLKIKFISDNDNSDKIVDITTSSIQKVEDNDFLTNWMFKHEFKIETPFDNTHLIEFILDNEKNTTFNPEIIYKNSEKRRISDNKLIVFNKNSIEIKEFTFSLIMQLDSDENISKSIYSIVNQSLNFSEHIQLILINEDTDEDLFEITEKFHKKYPENIFVYSKPKEENYISFGLSNSSAQYVTFLECGDFLSDNALEEAYNLIKENDEVNLVSIPFIINDSSDAYELNDKFNDCNDKGYAMIDLEEKSQSIQTLLQSTLIKSSIIKECNKKFDPDSSLEDMLLVNKLLIKENKLALLNTCSYNSFKDKDYSFRTVYECEDFLSNIEILQSYESSEKNSSYHDNVLLYYIKEFVNKSSEINIDDSILSRLSKILLKIDINNIVNHNYLDNDLKTFLQYLRGNENKEIKTSEEGNLYVNKENINNSSEIFIEDMDIDKEKIIIKTCLDSYLNTDYINIELVQIEENNENRIITPIDENKFVKDYLGINWKYSSKYIFNIDLDNTQDNSYYFKVNYEDNNDKISFNPKIKYNTTIPEDKQVIKENTLITLNDEYFKAGKGFNFSIVIAIYNTGEYLYETFDSIINQTLDFKENVQLILVDDGSEDNSKEICLDYQRKYPENIKVISQLNSGQATARNNGLKYVKGKYVNFLDSDDYLSENTLENVLEFFNKHESEIDLVAIPIKFFGRNENYHLLNDKFKKDAIIDLEKDANNPQLSASSAFFKKDLFTKFQFATDIITSEDSIMINEILLEKMKYGVVHSAMYYYRKRYDESSTIDRSRLKKEFFTDKLDKYFKKLEDYSCSKTGKVEPFIQYLIAYDIQWLMKEPELSLLDEEEKKEFWTKLKDVVRKLDEKVVLNNNFITNPQFKDFFRYMITGNKEVEIKNNNAVIKVSDKQIDSLQSHTLWIDIVEIKNDFLNISGFLNSNFSYDNIEIVAVKENWKGDVIGEYVQQRVEYPTRKDMKFLEYTWQYKNNFDLKVPLEVNEKCRVKILTRYYPKDAVENIVYRYLKINFHKHARLSNQSNYKVKDSHLLTFKNNAFELEGYRFKKMRQKEQSFREHLKKSKPNGFKEAINLRRLASVLYFINTRFLRKQIYLFMDRTNKADDNSEHLFKYANQQGDGIKKYFILEKDSRDYNRLSKIGTVVGYKTFKHKLLYLLAHKIIASHPDESLLNPFYDDDKNKDTRTLYNGLITSDIYFLQHGVTKDDIAYYLRKYDKNLSLIVTVSEEERESFTDGRYAYDPDIVQVLGFPRYDNLKNDNNKKRILIIPTWRNYLEGSEKLFTSSEYYENLNNLVKDERLIKLAKEHDYEILFKPHPRLEYTIPNTDIRYLDLFEFDDNIKISYDETYPELFETGSLLITDYSSVFFDFAYLKKPIIYYHYADDYHHEDSYFDYESMGFGDKIKSHDDLINKIEEYILNDCKMEDKYVDRVNNFFKYTDKNNCKRVYDWIKNH